MKPARRPPSERLIDMRAQLVASLGEQISAGELALLAGVRAGIDALDEAEQSAAVLGAEPAISIGIADDPAQAITLTLYTVDRRGLAKPLSPQYALALAGKLIAAAARRI